MNPTQPQKALSYLVLGTSSSVTNSDAPTEKFENFSTPFKLKESNFAYSKNTPLDQASSIQQLY